MDPLEKAEIASSGLSVTRLGLGGGSVAGLYQEVPHEQAVTTVRGILDMGVNYIDTAPQYGNGNGEERFGEAVQGRPRDSYAISTKVGRLLRPVAKVESASLFAGLPLRDWDFNFSRDGVLRSIEGSLERLSLEKVDILYIHDPHDHYEQAIGEAYPALAELRSQGVVRAIGVGIGNEKMLARFARDGDFDCFLLWGRYSLLDQSAMDELLPLCEEKGISIALGAPYESGILASDLKPGAKFRYRDAPPEVMERAGRIKDVCDRYQVPLKAAALQFVFGHPSVVTVIPGTRSVQRMDENRRMLEHPIPSDLWDELKREGLIREDVPSPTT